MIVLGIETSGDTAGVAVADGERPIASRAFPAHMTLCRDLAGHVQAVLGDAGGAHELDGIAVSLGPGSFTSLRIGVMTAKALAHRLEIPLVGVPTPEVIAAPLAGQTGHTIAVVQPAWGAALYVTVIPRTAPTIIRAPAAVDPDELCARLGDVAGAMLLVGMGAIEHRDALAAALGDRAEFAPASLGEPHAHFVVAAALSRLQSAGAGGALEVLPLYVVPSQAERVAGIDLGMTGVKET